MTNVKPTVVRVHGGFVDGVVGKEIYILRKDGYDVSLVPNPTLSLAGGPGRANGPVVPVGHSYGGAVITAADNDPKVSKLVYIRLRAGQGLVHRFPNQGPGARCACAADPTAAGRFPVPRGQVAVV